MPQETVLLTGFEPFGGETLNPALEIVRALDGTTIGASRVAGATLPVSFAAAPPILEGLLAQHRPGIALAIGQAGGRASLSLERVAINLVDARIADNDGLQPVDVAVFPGAPQALFATLPVKAMTAAMLARGVPAALSLSAGSFVCNQVFYALLHFAHLQHPGLRAGFLHVPWLPAQAARHPGQPCMALADMVEGVRAALACALATDIDLATPGGCTH